MPQFGEKKSKPGVSGEVHGTRCDRGCGRHFYLPMRPKACSKGSTSLERIGGREAYKKAPTPNVAEFYQLFIRNGLNESDEESQGKRLEIQDEISMHRMWKVAYQLAQKAEEKLKRRTTR